MLVHEDLQNCDEHIALIEIKSALFGVCVLSLTSFSVPERKSFFSQYWVSLLPLHLQSIIFLGVMFCNVLHDVLDVVGDNFGLFQTGSRCSNPAKLRQFVKFNPHALVLRNPVLC